MATRLIGPGDYYDSGAPAANGGTLKDYIEDNSGNNWDGRNIYSGQGGFYDLNASIMSKLYNSGTTYQGQDTNGYYEWWRPLNRKKALPLYPSYASNSDIFSSSNRQLFPHPQLATCGFYLDPNGTVPASGYSFYVVGLCQAIPSSDRCTVDRLNVREAKERIEWARQCGLRQNIGSPSRWFDTGELALDQSTTLKDYSEAVVPDDRRYSGSGVSYEINAAYVSALYKSGTSAYQALDAQGYYKWGRDPSLVRQRPLYPIFGTSPDINSGALLTPGTGSDCNLYNGATPVTSFYVNKYCESVY
ncbi:hypothetical protein [Stigmatella aurantiaca]|uniref:Uncharacterized protein n=1 Tax=Stigmatella aurantiaca (strain DW4/3-1) TaxID=378806 RepID=E3FMB7_STIAD|nr:hypothetical protein [Stigmatella aurantiaca]ADO69316.1 uncharacterized protein STAUR_1512 [Stigmatella aurantiaca DW4/3-1]